MQERTDKAIVTPLKPHNTFTKMLVVYSEIPLSLYKSHRAYIDPAQAMHMAKNPNTIT